MLLNIMIKINEDKHLFQFSNKKKPSNILHSASNQIPQA